MSDPKLAEFQEASVKVICDRLLDKKGARRFLLADEVGLGKTIVARGVIEELLRRKRQLDVVYLCSNVEIADQNRTKLDPEATRPLRRVTDLACTKPPDRKLRLYSFTPGTSLHDGTGLAWERRLILYLAFRVLGADIRKGKWREFFRCGAGEETWSRESQFRSLRAQFRRVLSRAFQAAVRDEWKKATTLGDETLVAADVLAERVASYDRDDPTSRRRRNQLVGLLRQGVQRVALDLLDPDLVILDEVQRFRDVIEDADSGTAIAARLFQRGAAVLVLSATPYRMLSLEHEGNGHYSEFLDTVRFLFGARGNSEVGALERDLEEFRSRLESGEFLKKRDARLLSLRARIEERLGRVISRTERNWYIESHGQGVEEVRPSGDGFAAPVREELSDYVRLRRFLLDKVETSQHITEYWKSCPAPFTFMDAQYSPMLRTRKSGQALPSGLVAPPRDLGKLSSRSLRFRELFRAAFGAPDSRWRFLWTRPTYTYYGDEFFGLDDPRKFLVFSCWRFVPKAIALLASHEAERRIRPSEASWRDEEKPPLRFTEKGSFHIFDVCFPSPALASLISPASLGSEGLSAKDVLRRTEAKLKQALTSAGVALGDTNKGSAWEVVARLEANSGLGDLRAALTTCAAHSGKETGERFREHVDEFLGWMEGDSRELRISRERLTHLAQVAAFSPASSLLRSFWSVFEESHQKVPEGFVDLCFRDLRSYFNRRVVRAIVEETTRESGYARAVIRYCEQAHFQAVADEYLFLMRSVLGRGSPTKAAEHLSAVLGIGVGTPNINLTSRSVSGGERLRSQTLTRRSHFALAFGEDVSSEQGAPLDQSARSRKTAVREAFNSPFWPFVLATTSAGQEGLDFHLFCQDIVHWNLPSNPVDLEQREGRINRRDGLALRRNIARDWPLARVAASGPTSRGNLWESVFAGIDRDPGPQVYKHGLYPHWVYDCQRGDTSHIRRHLFFYENSKDASAYSELKDRLTLYRLVFGQPRQQDLLDRIQRGVQDAGDRKALQGELTRYMINLSPITAKHARARAWREALRLLASPRELKKLLADVSAIGRDRSGELAGVKDDLELLTDLVGKFVDGEQVTHAQAKRAIFALCYLRDPYDSVFDVHTGLGLEDDSRIVAHSARQIRAARGS